MQNLKPTKFLNYRHPLVHLIWLGGIKNGGKLGQNGSVKLALTLSHIMPNVVDQTFKGGAWLGGRKAKPRRPSTHVNECSHLGKCHGRAKGE